MATTVGRSAEAAVKAGIFAALNVAALTTALGYPVKVYGTVPQTFTYPHVRVDAAGELQNSVFGRNGKDCRAYIHVFDNDPSDLRTLTIQSTVIALLNPVDNYHAITVEGYTVVHVNYDGSQAGDPSDEVGVRIFHRTVMVTVTVEES
jgi:hypothetical protein